MKDRKIEALDLLALAIDVKNSEGTPRHREALELLHEAKRQWRQSKSKRCTKCGR